MTTITSVIGFYIEYHNIRIYCNIIPGLVKLEHTGLLCS
jgi:hypothetical protein